MIPTRNQEDYKSECVWGGTVGGSMFLIYEMYKPTRKDKKISAPPQWLQAEMVLKRLNLGSNRIYLNRPEATENRYC